MYFSTTTLLHNVITPSSRAKCIYLYKNLGTKFQICCANVYFNQQYLKQVVIPKYAQLAYVINWCNKVVVLTYIIKYFITFMSTS